MTRQRLYLDTMQEVFSNTSKVLVTGNKNGQSNLLYLPLDKMVESGRNTSTPPASSTAASNEASTVRRRTCNNSKHVPGESLMSNKSLIALIVGVVVAIAAWNCFYIVAQTERAVLLQFGRVVRLMSSRGCM